MQRVKRMKTKTSNIFQNVFNVVLFLILIAGIFLNIYLYITPSHKIREIDLRLLGLEKLIYNIEEEE